jgi:hypothetical protein
MLAAGAKIGRYEIRSKLERAEWVKYISQKTVSFIATSY